MGQGWELLRVQLRLGIQKVVPRKPAFGFPGFGFLVGILFFSVQQGCTMVAASPNWVAGTVWFSIAVLTISIWRLVL